MLDIITKEENGKQSLYATDENSNKIDIDVNSGSDLLVNGTSVMGSIRGLADGVRATTALNSAFSAVPAMSGDREFECGMGLGRYGSKTAIATSCGARINEDLLFNVGASALPEGTQSYLLGNLPAISFRAGLSWKFGKSYGSSSTSKVSGVRDEFWNSHQLSELRQEMSVVNKRADKAEKEITLLRQKLVEFAQLKKTVAHLASVVTTRRSLAMKASLRH